MHEVVNFEIVHRSFELDLESERLLMKRREETKERA